MMCMYAMHVCPASVFSSEPPTQPRSVEVVSVTATTVTLRWEPSDDGGRDDLMYILYYQEVGSDMPIEAGSFENTEGTVAGMLRFCLNFLSRHHRSPPKKPKDEEQCSVHTLCVCCILGLTEGVTYEFFVTAKNGVSDQVPSVNLTEPWEATPTGSAAITAIVVGVVIACLIVVFLVIIIIIVALCL